MGCLFTAKVFKVKWLIARYDYCSIENKLQWLCIKHFLLQTTTEMLREVMTDCKRNIDSSNGIFSEVKILVVSHNIPERLYQSWMFKTLEIQSARLDSYDSSESTDKIVLDCLVQLLKLGNHLSKIPKVRQYIKKFLKPKFKHNCKEVFIKSSH